MVCKLHTARTIRGKELKGEVEQTAPRVQLSTVVLARVFAFCS